MIKNNTERMGGVDLLKSIAIILVVLCHSMPDSNGIISGNTQCVLNLNIPTANIQYIIILLLKNCGMIGNDIFIACSAYFLLNDNCVKIKKIGQIICDSFVVSVSISLVLYLLKFPGVTTRLFIKSFFPILTNATWFITCYLILYIIHPALNRVIINMNKIRLLSIVLLMLFFYSILGMIYRNAYYYNDLVGFIIIYFIVAYIKIYLSKFASNNRLNVRLLTIVICLHLFITILFCLMGYWCKTDMISMLRFNTNINPLFILIALFALNIACNSGIDTKYITRFSKLSMLIYIIHRNTIINGIVKYSFFDYYFLKHQYSHILFLCIMYACIALTLSLIFSVIYKKSIQKIAYKIFEHCLIYSEKVINDIITELSKLE